MTGPVATSRPDHRMPAPPRETDNWPRTTRLLPWMIALFMGMIFLVPFDSAELPGNLPFDLRLDRIGVAVMALVWLATVIAAKPGAPRLRRSPVNLALAAFATVAIVSVLVNLQALAIEAELTIVLKRLVLLGALATFFFVVASSVRPGEVPAFLKLLLGLAIVTAIGVIIEYRLDRNLFVDVANPLLPGPLIDPSYDLNAVDSMGRRAITGPAAHGLAVTTLIAFAVPLAVMGAMRARELRPQLFYWVLTAVLLSGCISTVRKSAAIVPVVGFVVLALYRPRQMLRLSPLLLGLVILVHFMAPGAMGGIRSQFFPKEGFDNSPSVRARKEDRKAVEPDILNHPVIGRGYGAYDPAKYRLLDNQYLGLRITTGWLGYTAFILLLLSVALVGHRLFRSGDPSRAPPAIMAISAAGIVAAASKLFDALAFPQVPYTLMLIAGLAVALSQPVWRSRAAPAPVPREPWLRPDPTVAGAYSGAHRG